MKQSIDEESNKYNFLEAQKKIGQGKGKQMKIGDLKKDIGLYIEQIDTLKN